MIVVTVLKCGGEYTEEHVAWLTKQLPGHEVYCITDSSLPDKQFKETTGATKIVLRYDAWGAKRKWWAKMEIFRPELHTLGDFLYVDLDTVILKPFTAGFGPAPIVLADFYFPGTSIGSGLMWLPLDCRAFVWERWIACPQDHIAHNFGDQDFLTPWLWNADRWQDRFPKAVISYKKHLSPDESQQFFEPGYDDLSKVSIVCFHGNPRPWMARQRANHEWIPE